jgi:hypothetical protein
MDFMTPFYPSTSLLRKKHPEYNGLKVFNQFGRNGCTGTLRYDGSLEVATRVIRIAPKDYQRFEV